MKFKRGKKTFKKRNFKKKIRGLSLFMGTQASRKFTFEVGVYLRFVLGNAFGILTLDPTTTTIFIDIPTLTQNQAAYTTEYPNWSLYKETGFSVQWVRTYSDFVLQNVAGSTLINMPPIGFTPCLDRTLSVGGAYNSDNAYRIQTINQDSAPKSKFYKFPHVPGSGLNVWEPVQANGTLNSECNLYIGFPAGAAGLNQIPLAGAATATTSYQIGLLKIVNYFKFAGAVTVN